ncbi:MULTISPECIES: hypothetical protein [Providencia]|uniref:Lipoprotein n=1 Tax=Providencia rettgeri TaxID=587 RepID=A0AB35L8Z2_PRORE|nr:MULTISPECIES: hypothetical protein [Providencia]MDH2304779.1 hypothetical protein [Providencia rettgeri]
MKKLLLGLLLCSVGFGAVADWKYSEKVDEMRGTTQYFASLAPEKENEGVKLIIKAESQNNQEVYDFHFELEGGDFDCKLGKLCSGLIKINNHKIKELLVEVDKVRQSEASIIGAFKFANDLADSRTIYIEVPVFGKGMMQFKYEPNKLKWSM